MNVGEIALNKNVKNAVKIASVYIGTVLGAGFASGQEMVKFFAYYGSMGMFGLLLTGVLFAVVGWAVLEIVFVNKATNYKSFINPIAGNFFGRILEWVVIFFMFICFCAMFAGCGALFEQRFGLPYIVGVLIMAGCCFITFLFDIKGVIAVNAVLAPLLLIGGFVLGLYMWFFRSTAVMNGVVEAFIQLRDNWFSSAIIYVSYNIITAVVVLTTLYKLITNKTTAKLGAYLAGIALGLLGIVLGLIVLIYYSDIRGVEIPLLTIVMKYAPLVQYIYILVLISAMFTTAVANGYGILNKINELKTIRIHYKVKLALFILIAIIFSQIGFSNMVGKVYPLFGYFGVFEIILILLYFIKYKINVWNHSVTLKKKKVFTYHKQK